MVPASRPPARRRARLLLAAVLVAVAAASVLTLSRVDLGGAAASLAGAHPELLAAAVALYALHQTLAGAAWGACQGAGGIRIPLATTLGLHWIARSACALLPAGLGEGVRVAAVRRHPEGAAAGAWRIAGGFAGYKLVESAATALVVLVIVLATPLPGAAAGLRWMAIAAVAGALVLVAAWRLGRVGRLARILPGRARGVAARLGEGAGVLADAPAARLAGALVLGALVARIGSLAALLAALDVTPAAAPLAFAALVLAGALPGAPGGAGAREVVMLPALAMAHGVGAAQALAFSVAIQATSLATSLVLGAAALAWLGPALAAGRRPPDPEVLAPEPAAARVPGA